MTAITRIMPIYAATCPNCGGRISAERLLEGLVCKKCLPQEDAKRVMSIDDYYERVKMLGRLLSERNMLKGYSLLYTSVLEIDDFREFFKKATGSHLWSAQLTWAKRLLQNESLAIVAPTGVGKTTLLTIYALYRVNEGARVYYLLPTENLARQVEDKLVKYSKRLGLNPRIAAYYSSMTQKRRIEELRKIEERDYEVLVTTTSFLSRRWPLLKDTRFDVILVDDVDAVLRNSKNIDKLLLLLGFDEESVDTAYTLVKKKIAALVAKVSGQMQRYARLLEEIKELEAKLTSKLSSLMPGQLVIASATGRTYGIKPKVFRELLGFEIGRVHDYIRSVASFYKVSENPVEEAADIIEKLGSGGLVYVSKRLGKEAAKKLVEVLEGRGIRAGLALAGRRVLDKFQRGEYDVLVGIASYYGVIVRGVDMPERVLYTVFVGTPGSAMDAAKALSSPYRIVRVALELGLIGEKDPLVRQVAKLSPGEATALRIALSQGGALEGRLGEILEQLLHIRRRIVLSLKGLLCGGQGVKEVGGLIFRCVDNMLVAESVDAATYVQASGRASRMLGLSMTHGVSIVIDNEYTYIKALERKLKRFVEDHDFKKFDWPSIRKELVRAIESRHNPSTAKKVNIETSLIIVESPTKAKTIASFFGKPVRRRLGSLLVYETTFYNNVSGKIHVAAITASTGHVYDLSIDGEGIYGVELANDEARPVYKYIRKCLNCGHQFSSETDVCPRCGSSNIASKEEVIAALRQLAMENEVVYIATDPDIEGEKIAYDLYAAVKPYARSVKRIEMHAITRGEFMKALAKPRGIDAKMVDAQLVRRIEDRWIGFSLSQKLWNVFQKHWLGAGRVQTPVLGWIIDRYSEWRTNRGYNVYIRLSERARVKLHYRFKEEAERVAKIAQEEGLTVIDLEQEVRKVNPPPPFTTETLLYEASRRYGYPAQKTMRIAQELFEAGLITYHRTDSTYVSSDGISVAREYLSREGYSELFVPRHWGEPGHHEAIRPTRPIDAETLRKLVASGEIRVSISLRESHYRIYDMVFRRFIASQMAPANIAYAKVRLSLATEYLSLEAPVKPLEPGWTRVQPLPYIPALGALAPGAKLKPLSVYVAKGSTVQLYSHGDVVKLMKERGLGRPSTYAKTIDAILRHGYVIESKYRRKLVPTKLGIEVYEYLEENYTQLVSEKRTRKLMEEIEAIASGSLSAAKVVEELYQELEALIEENLKAGHLTSTTELHAS